MTDHPEYDLTDAEIAEEVGDSPFLIGSRRVRMGLEIQRRREAERDPDNMRRIERQLERIGAEHEPPPGWQQHVVDMTVLETRAADAVKAATKALASALLLAGEIQPPDITAIATLAGAILLAGQAVR